MPHRIAGIDVHKKMLAVVVSDVEVDGEYDFERCRFSTSPDHLRLLVRWLIEREVQEVVMESTAQYWKPVWEVLERYWKAICRKGEHTGPRSGTMYLAQAKSNRGPRGRKRDFPDAERLVKRLVANELNLSFVPDSEQRLWRTVTRRKYQLTRSHVRLQNQLESLLEECHIKLSSFVSDLLGVSARRILKALANGETDPAALAALAHQRLRATPAQLVDALGACTELNPVYRRLLKLALEELQLMEQQSAQLDQEMAMLLKQHQDAVQRLAEVPGLGIDSAHQIIAEVGPRRPHFLPTSISPPGSAHVLEMKRVRGYHTIIVPQKGTPICAAFSIKCQCCGQTQRQHLSGPLPAVIASLGTQSNHRGYRT